MRSLREQASLLSKGDLQVSLITSQPAEGLVRLSSSRDLQASEGDPLNWEDQRGLKLAWKSPVP